MPSSRRATAWVFFCTAKLSLSLFGCEVSGVGDFATGTPWSSHDIRKLSLTSHHEQKGARAHTYNNDNSINVRTVENVETSGPKKGAWFFVARNPYKVVKIALQMEDVVHFCGDLRMSLPPTMVGLRRDSFPGDPSAVKGGWIGPVVEKTMASFPSYFVVERSETSSA